MRFSDFRRMLAEVARDVGRGRAFVVELPADYDAIRVRFGVLPGGRGMPYVDFDAAIITECDEPAARALVEAELRDLLKRETRGTL